MIVAAIVLSVLAMTVGLLNHNERHANSARAYGIWMLVLAVLLVLLEAE